MKNFQYNAVQHYKKYDDKIKGLLSHYALACESFKESTLLLDISKEILDVIEQEASNEAFNPKARDRLFKNIDNMSGKYLELYNPIFEINARLKRVKNMIKKLGDS